jgi:transglutaminase-like putative cysteine protease
MRAARARQSARIELACFAALAALAALQWSSLVENPPVLGVIASVALATGAGGAVAVGRPLPLSPRALRAAGVALAIVAILIGMLAVGLPARLLLPDRWHELVTNVRESLQGIGDVPVPYAGADFWTRLAILLAAPLTVGVAALVAFWPKRHRAAGRICALVLLVGLYLVAVAWARPSGQLIGGAALLVLICTWLWLPALSPDRWLGAAVALAAAAVVAVPAAVIIDRGGPLLDYRHWGLFSADGLSFRWDQSYGPLDWPQRGTRMLVIASDGAHYWKVTNLDEFDGIRWVRSSASGPEPALGEPRAFHPKNQPPRPASEWVDRINLEVRGLSSAEAVGAGTVLALNGIEGRPHRDAVWETGSPLDPGDSYTALIYDPEPSEAEMAAAGTAYPSAARRYVSFSLSGGASASPAPPSAAGSPRSIQVPFWSSAGPAAIEPEVSGTPYEGMYTLARSLAAGAATPYTAVRRVENYLRTSFDYRQHVPNHTYPLPAFLSEDRAGYCQQFSGAMALMLRMLGIPSRVAAGFAPGGRDPERNTFLVDDTDAHDWVEVFFPRIGWVTFDPTPGAAPAATQQDDNALGVTDPGGSSDVSVQVTPPEQSSEKPSAESQSTDVKPAPHDTGTKRGSSSAAVPIAAGAAALLLALAASYGLRARRRRRLHPDELAEAELAELRRSLARVGTPLPAGTTLLGAERDLGSSVGPAAGAYAASLRTRRYRNPEAPPPGVRERRALRRELISRAGVRRFLRVLWAIPPGGPGRHRDR